MKKKIVTVRGVQIGTGVPKICVPLVAAYREALEKELERVQGSPYDLVEWRADFYKDVEDKETREEALALIRSRIGDSPLLFTFRSEAEGGSRAMEMRAYCALNAAVAQSGLADLIDVEAYRGEEQTRRLVEAIHAQGICVIGSNHDFQKTPAAEELIGRLRYMQELGADITKLAVMPQNRRDVIWLLDAAVQMEEQYADRPCVTMAMGKLGVISRISGIFSGSAITFATAGSASAPGQIPAKNMTQILQILSGNIE